MKSKSKYKTNIIKKYDKEFGILIKPNKLSTQYHLYFVQRYCNSLTIIDIGASFHCIHTMLQAFCDLHRTLNLGIPRGGRHSENTVFATG